MGPTEKHPATGLGLSGSECTGCHGKVRRVRFSQVMNGRSTLATIKVGTAKKLTAADAHIVTQCNTETFRTQALRSNKPRSALHTTLLEIVGSRFSFLASGDKTRGAPLNEGIHLTLQQEP